MSDEADGAFDMGFDGIELGSASSDGCNSCENPMHTHDKERIYPDDGPAGSYHYTYICP